MDWFERIAGFREQDYASTQSRFEVVGTQLRSKVNHKAFEIGNLSLPSLGELREQVQGDSSCHGRLRVSLMTGNVRDLHQEEALKGALFQVASQFNMLEMTSHNVTPEDGVTRYQDDPTQGPACAIAAGAATIFRNYFAPNGGGIGQGSGRQIDGLADVGIHLSGLLGVKPGDLWNMRNGYALCTDAGLKAICSLIGKSTPSEIDDIRCKLRIGVHTDVQVTDIETSPPRLVSQAFCSALPVAYSNIPRLKWTAFAKTVLDAAYEATMWAGLINARRGRSNVVLLTRLGGGAFGNDDNWIHDAIKRSLDLASGFDLDVRIVSQHISPKLLEIPERFK